MKHLHRVQEYNSALQSVELGTRRHCEVPETQCLTRGGSVAHVRSHACGLHRLVALPTLAWCGLVTSCEGAPPAAHGGGCACAGWADIPAVIGQSTHHHKSCSATSPCFSCVLNRLNAVCFAVVGYLLAAYCQEKRVWHNLGMQMRSSSAWLHPPVSKLCM